MRAARRASSRGAQGPPIGAARWRRWSWLTRRMSAQTSRPMKSANSAIPKSPPRNRKPSWKTGPLKRPSIVVVLLLLRPRNTCWPELHRQLCMACAGDMDALSLSTRPAATRGTGHATRLRRDRQTLAGVAVLVGRWPRPPGTLPNGPPKPGPKCIPGPGVPFTKAVMPAVRLDLIVAAIAAVILPDETAASIRLVASATRSLMIFWTSTFLELAMAAMLCPARKALFRSAGVMVRSLATMSRDAAPPPKPNFPKAQRGPMPGRGEAFDVGLGVGVWAPDRPGIPRKRPSVAPAPTAASRATAANSLRWLMVTSFRAAVTPTVPGQSGTALGRACDHP